MTLLSELRSDQHSLVKAHIQKYLMVSDQCIAASVLGHSNSTNPNERLKRVGSFWLRCNQDAGHVPENYIITESVKKNLDNLSRAISARYVHGSQHREVAALVRVLA